MSTSVVSKKSVKVEGKVIPVIAERVRTAALEVNTTEYNLVAELALAMTRKRNRVTIEDMRASIEAGLARDGKAALKFLNVKPAYAQDFPLVAELFALEGGTDMSLADLFNMARDLRAYRETPSTKSVGTAGAHVIVAESMTRGESMAELRERIPTRSNNKPAGKKESATLEDALSQVLQVLEGVTEVNGKQALLIQSVTDRLASLKVKR